MTRSGFILRAMSTPEGALTGTPDVSSSPSTTSTSDVASTSGAATSSVAMDTSSAPSEQSAGIVSAGAVQEPSNASDPFDQLPSVDELNEQAGQGVKYAKALAELRGYAEPIRNQLTELQDKWKIFEPVSDKFSAPEEVQQLADLRDGLFGWEKGEDGRLIPATQRFVENLDANRAEFVFADLADAMIPDPRNPGQSISRMDKALQYVAQNPESRANALRILGAVEPTAVAPQWQPTQDQLSVVKEELQDTFKALPYDEREALSTNEPDFINKYLAKEKLQNDLMQEREQRTQRDQQLAQQHEQALQQEASQAGDAYVDKLLLDGLSTFHNSVVEQCKFIEPLDMGNLPQGMSPEQAGQMNAQIAEANKAEAAQITAQIVALINPQTRRYMLPTLKEIGVVDDRLMAEIDKAAQAVGDNGRNYGSLTFVGQKRANGSGYQPGADVVPLNNEAQRNFKLIAHYANQIKGRLMEKRSQFFSMKATGHNQILNGVGAVRPSANGSSYDPTTAATQRPSGFMSRAEIEATYGS